MNLDTAVGIKNCDIDVATGQKLTHEEVYGRKIEFLGGVEAVSKYVPFSIDKIRNALKKDYYLNNLSMQYWDAAAGFVSKNADCTPTCIGIWELYREHGTTYASCAEGVCILKETARRLVKSAGAT